MKKAKHVFMQPGGCMKMYFTPPVPKKPDGGSGGGVAPPVGLGFGIPPAARVRVRPHYPELPVPGPRRDMGWVWDWVLGLGNISRRPKIQKNQISNISRRPKIWKN